MNHRYNTTKPSSRYLAAAAVCFIVGAIINATVNSNNALALSEALLLAVTLFLVAACVAAYRERR